MAQQGPFREKRHFGISGAETAIAWEHSVAGFDSLIIGANAAGVTPHTSSRLDFFEVGSMDAGLVSLREGRNAKTQGQKNGVFE